MNVEIEADRKSLDLTRVDPPGIMDFMRRVGGMTKPELNAHGEAVSSRYETLRSQPRIQLEEYGEVLSAGTEWDRIVAVECLCEMFWINHGAELTVVECLRRLVMGTTVITGVTQ
jgi:hypothetical protein